MLWQEEFFFFFLCKLYHKNLPLYVLKINPIHRSPWRSSSVKLLWREIQRQVHNIEIERNLSQELNIYLDCYRLTFLDLREWFRKCLRLVKLVQVCELMFGSSKCGVEFDFGSSKVKLNFRKLKAWEVGLLV